MTNVFLDGEVCLTSVFDVNVTSAEGVTDMLRDSRTDSSVESVESEFSALGFRITVPFLE